MGKSLIQFTLLVGIVGFCAAESFIPGFYERELKPENKEFIDLMVATGQTKEKAEKVTHTQVKMIITEHPDKSVSLHVIYPDKQNYVTIVNGQEYDDFMLGTKNKRKFTILPNQMLGHREMGDDDSTSVVDFSKEGLTTTLSYKKLKASYKWKRIPEFVPEPDEAILT